MGPGEARARVLRLQDGLPWREIDGAVVVLDLQTSSYFSVNRTGTTLWQHLVAGATVDELADALAAAEELDGRRARADVEAFIDDLDRQGFLAP